MPLLSDFAIEPFVHFNAVLAPNKSIDSTSITGFKSFF